MSYMFYSCLSLISLHFSIFKTNNVKYMSYMFLSYRNCLSKISNKKYKKKRIKKNWNKIIYN